MLKNINIDLSCLNLMTSEEKTFSIKCQCSVFKHGLLKNNKKKSKFSNLSLKPQSQLIQIVPLNSKQQPIVFQLKHLKHIHRKFISQGKMTLQFTQIAEKIPNPQTIDSTQNQKTQRLSQVFIQAASPQNLQLMIKKIVDIKKNAKNSHKSNTKKEENISARSKNPKQKNTKTNENQILKGKSVELVQSQRKRLSMLNQQKPIFKQQKMTRKQLITQAFNKQSVQLKQVPQRPLNQIKEVDILALPNIILEKIFSFSHFQLRHRLISKKFNNFVLHNILSISFKDQVDQQTFDKLAKYAININGRLKNVRHLNLINRFSNDDSLLEKNKAKSLYFGTWKQMSKKNAFQIKGLRIHTLQIPYQLKFDISNFHGIKLRQLHLYSKNQVTTPNNFIKQKDLLQIIKFNELLEAFSIPYTNSSLIDQISSIDKQKIKLIKSLSFGVVNANTKSQNWAFFHIYQNLKSLSLQKIFKGGVKDVGAKLALTLPANIQQLQIGSIIDPQLLGSLPESLKRLKLSGDYFLNMHLQNISLPQLKVLDVVQANRITSTLVRHLGVCNNLLVVTNWQRQDIQFWNSEAKEKNIRIQTVRYIIRK